MTDNVRNDDAERGSVLQLTDTPRPEYKLSAEDLNDLSPKQDLFIDYMAFGAFTLNSAGMMDQMTAEQVANKLGVTDRTLRRWRRSIPNYAALVTQRRRDKFKIEIEDGVWRGLIAKALMGEAKQAEMVLSHFSDYTPPAQKVEHRVDGLSDLVQLARASQRARGVVTDAPQNIPAAARAAIEAQEVQPAEMETPSPQNALETVEVNHDSVQAPAPVARGMDVPTKAEVVTAPIPAIPVHEPVAFDPIPQTVKPIRVIQPDPDFDDMP